jgi:hypothetical protein
MRKTKNKIANRNKTSETDDDLAFTIELAEGGDVHWQKQLAEMYREGAKIPKNDVLAFHWALKAALQGESDSMFHVGLAYFQGLGVEPNKNEAIKWLSRLAYPETSEATYSHQMPNAQSWMSTVYYSPGEPHDISIAYGWLLLAICYSQPWDVEETPFNSQILNSQRETAVLMEQVKAKYESELTAAQRAKGQQMAAELFRPIEYDDDEE